MKKKIASDIKLVFYSSAMLFIVQKIFKTRPVLEAVKMKINMKT